MKRIVSALLMIIMIVSMIPMSAVAATENGYTFTVSYGEATITGVDDTVTGDVVIPDTLGDCKVVAIGDNAFNSNKTLTSIVIPEGVRSIGKKAFYSCDNLKSIDIPASLTSIGESVFEWDYDLEAVYIHDLSAWCKIKFDGERATPACNFNMGKDRFVYLNGEPIKNLIIPEDVTSVSNYAFYRWYGLESVTFHGGVESVGAYAFAACTGLSELVLPEGVVSIGNHCFSGSGIKKITIPATLRNIGSYAFYDVSIEELHISDIASWCLVDVADMHPLTYPGLGKPKGNMYVNGKELTDLVIPSGVTSISENAFYDCSTITSVYIPETVTNIGAYAFGSAVANVVYIDSADVAGSISNYYAAGYLTNGSKSVNVRSDIETTHNYITKTYTFTETITYNGSEYTSYSDHAHEWTDLNAEPKECTYDGFAGKRCTVCGTLSGESVTCHFETEIRDAVEATKESEGYTGNTHCANCGVKLALGEVIPKLYTPGDVNDDGKINVGDVSLLLKYLAKWDVTIVEDAADVTGEGKVNVADASLLLKYLAKWDVVLK